MRVLDRYITVTVLRSGGLVTAIVCALSIVSSFLGEANNMADYTPLQLILYVLLEVPQHLHPLMPAVAFLGSLLALGGLAAGSELVVMRASGVSVPRLGWSVARGGLVIAVATIVLGELIAPVTARIAEQGTIVGGSGIQSIDGSLWFREDRRMVRIDRILSEHVLKGITVYRGSRQRGLQSILRAESARYIDGQWILHNIRETIFLGGQIRVTQQDRMAWDVALKPSYLRLSVTEPKELSSLGLYRYSNYLQRNGVAAEEYRIALWRNLVMPFTVLVLTVLALPFAFGALRGAGLGQRLFIGGLAGLTFFMANEIAISSSLVYGLPPWLAATWPTALLAAGTLYWLRRMR